MSIFLLFLLFTSVTTITLFGPDVLSYKEKNTTLPTSNGLALNLTFCNKTNCETPQLLKPNSTLTFNKTAGNSSETVEVFEEDQDQDLEKKGRLPEHFNYIGYIFLSLSFAIFGLILAVELLSCLKKWPKTGQSFNVQNDIIQGDGEMTSNFRRCSDRSLLNQDVNKTENENAAFSIEDLQNEDVVILKLIDIMIKEVSG